MKNLDIYSSIVPSSINSIGMVVDEFITNLQKTCGIIEDCILFELKVILNEVLINAVRHGNCEDANKCVKVNASISGKESVLIIVEDEGGGYDFECVCSHRKPMQSTMDPMDVNESGRGIMIVRSLCDDVVVNDKGNRIVLTKKLTRS